MMKLLLCVLLLTISLTASATNNQSIANKIEVLKQQAVLLHKDLAQLERDLVYPTTTQIAIYVSKKLTKDITIGSINLSIDGQDVASHIYTLEQNNALKLGGMQRLFMGNVAVGEHHFKITLKGIDSQNDITTIEGTAAYYKNAQPLSINVNLFDENGTKEPLLSVTRL